jgi:hypothetical protein
VTSLEQIAPAFVGMAHSIVWASVVTVDADCKPRHPEASVSYRTPSHDTCAADCLVEWYTDDETRSAVWEKFATGPAPVGYDPYIIPQWKDGPTSDSFAVLRMAPYRLRVMAGTVMTHGNGEVLSWRVP